MLVVSKTSLTHAQNKLVQQQSSQSNNTVRCKAEQSIERVSGTPPRTIAYNKQSLEL